MSKPRSLRGSPHILRHLVPIRDFCPNNEINKREYFHTQQVQHGVMKLKRVTLVYCHLALLVSPNFIINWYQVLLKPQLSQHEQEHRYHMNIIIIINS